MSQRLFSPLVFLLICLSQLILILQMNNGFFTYVLDDPYIHMALSEHLINGHYGANAGEFSSPSSSIVWPILLAPFALLGDWFVYIPLLLNLLFGALSCYFVSAITEYFWKSKDRNNFWTVLKCSLDIIFILGLNLVGLCFTGMEHCLQVFVVVYVLYALITREEKGGDFPIWFWFALFLGPLVRYENMAVSLPVLAFCFAKGFRKESVLCGFGILSLVVGFSLFLKSIEQDYLPASINAKDSVITSGSLVQAMFAKFFKHLHYLRRDLSFILLGILGWNILTKKRWKIANLNFVVSLFFAMLLHLFFGDFGWFSRYEIYMWSFCLLGVLYLKRDSWLYCFYRPKFWPKLLSVLMLLVIAQNYKHTLVKIGKGANNIYEQHYQMHRFVKKFYQKPVAANDIGYLLFDNPYYILDLWGLASIDAQKKRLSQPNNAQWMQELANDVNVGVVMIYPEWFPPLPSTWTKLGELHLRGERASIANDTVSFFVTENDTVEYVTSKLRAFVKTLPSGVRFEFVEN